VKNYRLKWTEDGRKRTSVVAYNKSSAEHRKQELEGQGVKDAEIIIEAPIFGRKI
jgi:hypothetical protein